VYATPHCNALQYTTTRCNTTGHERATALIPGAVPGIELLAAAAAAAAAAAGIYMYIYICVRVCVCVVCV